MTPDLWIMIAILIVCVALSAFFSASETAFTSVNRVKLKTLMQNGNKRAKLAYALAEDYGIATRPGAHCAPLMHRALGTTEQGAVRFSFSLFNTPEEVEIAIGAIKELAQCD